jgi:hypothetical protein
MKRVFFVLVILSFLPVSYVLYGQQKFPPKKDLVESRYYEGYRTHKNVKTGKFKLVSLIARSDEKEPEDKSQFKFDFKIPGKFAGKDIDIFVEDRLEIYYYMTPVRTKWTEGKHTFSWRSAKAAEENISLSNLLGLARLKNPDFARVIFPLAFYYSQRPEKITAYEFAFKANRPVTIRYKIMTETETPVLSSLIKNHPKNRNILFEWDCKDAAVGKYMLLVEYFFTTGTRKEKKIIYEFYHDK